jgi:hypothetical protein
MIGSIEQAIEESVSQSGDRAVAVIPEGPYVIPVYTPNGTGGSGAGVK